MVKQDMGVTPAVILSNPKYGRNVSGALRACSILGGRQLWFTGNRVAAEWQFSKRLPREERMIAYDGVDVLSSDHPYDAFPRSITIIGVEIVPSAIPLAYFEHPEDAVYVFGPEDGGLSKVDRLHCHQFIILPTDECANLAGAVYMTLCARRIQRQQRGLEDVRPSAMATNSQRGWIEHADQLG